MPAEAREVALGWAYSCAPGTCPVLLPAALAPRAADRPTPLRRDTPNRIIQALAQIDETVLPLQRHRGLLPALRVARQHERLELQPGRGFRGETRITRFRAQHPLALL